MPGTGRTVFPHRLILIGFHSPGFSAASPRQPRRRAGRRVADALRFVSCPARRASRDTRRNRRQRTRRRCRACRRPRSSRARSSTPVLHVPRSARSRRTADPGTAVSITSQPPASDVERPDTRPFSAFQSAWPTICQPVQGRAGERGVRLEVRRVGGLQRKRHHRHDHPGRGTLRRVWCDGWTSLLLAAGGRTNSRPFATSRSSWSWTTRLVPQTAVDPRAAAPSVGRPRRSKYHPRHVGRALPALPAAAPGAAVAPGVERASV